MNMKVNSQPCIRGDFVENQDASQIQQKSPETAPAPEANSTEQSEQISQSRKSEMDQSAKMKAAELQNTQKTNASQGTKSEAAQKVDAEMEKTRANGGNMRDAVIAGAKADEGNIHVGYYGISKGEDRMKEIYKDTANIPLEKNQKYDRNGQPMLQMKNGKGPSSWCGVWGTDIWRRAGCDCKWGLGKPTDSKGKELPRVNIDSHQDPKLQNVKPGDMIVTNTFDMKKGNTKEGSTNHHALVTSVDYEVAGQSGKITCPPAEVPKDGKVVGFHTMNGNSPGVPDAETKENPAIRAGYVDLKAKVIKEENGNKYETRISNVYPMPPAKK